MVHEERGEIKWILNMRQVRILRRMLRQTRGKNRLLCKGYGGIMDTLPECAWRMESCLHSASIRIPMESHGRFWYAPQ